MDINFKKSHKENMKRHFVSFSVLVIGSNSKTVHIDKIKEM